MTTALAARPLAVGVTHPHSGLGVSLLLLALLAAVGAIALIASRRPAPLAAGLSALTVVLGVSGVVALATTRDCPASGCGSAALLAPTASPSAPPTPEVTETPTPTPVATTTSPTPSPTPSPTTSPTPSRTPSPTPSPTPKRTPTPTPSATPKPAFTATLTQQPVCGFSGNDGTVTRPAVVTLTNTTSAIVSWRAAAQEALPSGSPWATVDPSTGEVPTAQRRTLTVTPDPSLCTPGNDAVTEHVTVTHDGVTITVAVTVTPVTG